MDEFVNPMDESPFDPGEVVPMPEDPGPDVISEGWVRLPIFRGFTEIEKLWEICQETGSYICGGYPRYMASPRVAPEPPGDVDIFPSCEESFHKNVAALQALGFEVRHENNMSVTFKRTNHGDWTSYCPTPQVIKPVKQGKIVSYGSFEEVLENFDFSVVRVGVLDPHTVLADVDFAEDERKRILRLKNIHCPISSMIRCMKYSKKGYYMRPSEVLRLYEEWDRRGDKFKADMIELFLKSRTGEITEQEVNHLEGLLWVD